MAARALPFALIASLAGLALLHLLGATSSMLLLHGTATVLGLATFAISRRAGRSVAPGIALLAALVVLTVALFGVEVGGARRWVALGPIALQPALILAPVILAAPAGRWTSAALLVCGFALALQPDAGTLGALAAAAFVRAIRHPDRSHFIGALAMTAFFVSTLFAPTGPAAVPLVEGVLQTAWSDGPGPSILSIFTATTMFLALLRAPALLVYMAGLVVASVAGPFPTPLLGASFSAMLGFWIAVGLAGDRVEATKA